MAGLTESEIYEAAVYQLEITDAVIGGANGLSNLQAKQLANRTNWLNANKQAKDATLTAIAALTTAADKLIYATGADMFSTTTLTAFARTLLDDADAATMRATIGAQAAGSYQASDATLTAIAALTTAADKLIYATGADMFSTTTLTAFARTLLDDADAATMRATIGAINSNDPMVAKAWVNFNAVPLSGTYSQTGTVITVTMTAHGMSTNMIANLDFTSGTATDGTDFVVTVTGANTFTVVGKTSVTTSGNVTRNNYIRSAFNVSTITDNGVGNYSVNHGIGNENYVVLALTGDYEISLSDLARTYTAPTSSYYKFVNVAGANGAFADSKYCFITFFGN